MRFRQHEAHARRRAGRLLFAFAIALAGVVLGVNLLAIGTVWIVSPAVRAAGSWPAVLSALPPHFVPTNTLVVLLLVLGGAWLERARLADGGAAVARALGARRIDSSPPQAAERRLRHVVDELALAARCRAPAVFVLDDEGINACAAGFGREDAAVIVTMGALRRLDRDELQGVVAHELAHVLNEDLALDMRLCAYAGGVLVLHQFGRWLIELAIPDERAPRHNAIGFNPFLLAAGAVAVAMGALGWLAARLLHAATNREREFLADATAVRLTRLPQGLGGALRKILGISRARVGAAPAASPAAWRHLWFDAPAGLAGWLASHPPLGERIRRVLGHDAGPLPAPLRELEDEPAASTSARPPAPDLPALDWPARTPDHAR